MSKAALILAALESCRHTAMLKLTALDAERPKVAYAAAVEDSVVAKQRWRELDDEAARLTERIALFNAALWEARERVLRRDWREQYREITKTEFNA
jgi:hypothetical protein